MPDRAADLHPRILVALDLPDATRALALARRLSPQSCGLKVGKELFTLAGPSLVRELVDRGHRVFLDLKFHDIPNTVASACRAAASLGVWMLNVHACGGRAMLQAAREAIDQGAASRPLLIAVTVLTSLSDDDCADLGWTPPLAVHVERLAALTQACGLDGVVCSPQEAATLRQRMGPDFRLVTPGVRPEGAERADQRRVMTPAAALAAGADHLVIGRPVTGAPDPVAALDAIRRSIGEVVA